MHHVEVIWEGVIYIDNDDIHTWENNVIGEGVYRPPPRVEVIGRGYINPPPPGVEVIGRGYID